MANELVPFLLTSVISGGAAGGNVGAASPSFIYTLAGWRYIHRPRYRNHQRFIGYCCRECTWWNSQQQHRAVVTVTPAAGAKSFTFSFTPGSAGNYTITFANAQLWENPQPLSYTATTLTPSAP
jgi:hypothetical protein